LRLVEHDAFTSLFNAGPLHWDVVLVSARLQDSEDTDFSFLSRVREAQTTSGYLVHARYLPKLLGNFLESSFKLNKNCSLYDKYAIDQFWKRLQPRDRWYAFSPLLGRQLPSFSDIEKREVDYKV
jgi:hypothetical protein